MSFTKPRLALLNINLACLPVHCPFPQRPPGPHPHRHKFNVTTLKLLVVAALGGLFTGTRGGLFSVSNFGKLLT